MRLSEYEQLLKKHAAPPKRGIHSYMHEVALEVSEYVREPQKYAMWLGITKRVGTRKMVSLLKQMRKKGIKSPQYLMRCVKKREEAK